MGTNQSAQIEVLSRIADMLDEHSVQYAAEQDESFRQFVDRLYDSVHHQADAITQ